MPKIKNELAQVIWPTTFYLFEHPVEVEGTVILGIGGQYQGPETDNDGNINGPDVWLQVLLKKVEMGAEQTITYTEQPSANDIKAFQKIPKPLGVNDKGNTTSLKYFKINVKNPSQSEAYSVPPNCQSCLKKAHPLTEDGPLFFTVLLKLSSDNDLACMVLVDPYASNRIVCG